MERLDLNRIRQFMTLAEMGNFGRAAKRIGIEQTSLTKSMKALEKECGTELFIRHSLGALLTEQGAKLQVIAGKLLSMTRQIEDLSKFSTVSRKIKTGNVISLGVPAMISSYVIPVLFAKLKESIPDVSVTFFEGDPSYIEQGILSGHLDFALSYNPPSTERLTIIPVLREKIIVVVPPMWVNNFQASMSIRDLCQLPLILQPDNHVERRVLEKQADQQGLFVKPVIECSFRDTIVRLVNSGIGCSIMSKFSASETIRLGGVSMVNLFPELSMQLTLISVRDASPRDETSAAIRGVLKAIGDIVRSSFWTGAEISAFTSAPQT